MANGSHVPQFDNWENQDNVPYTVFFDKARKGRTETQMVNPNDLEDIPSILSDNPDPVGAAPPVSRSKNELTNPVRQYPYPSPNHENMVNRNAREANLRSNRSEQSVNCSPLHRQAKGRESPSSGGNRSYESNQGAPAKMQMKPSNNSRSNDSFDKAAAVPKFGGWNNDLTSAESFTHIFNKARDERNKLGGWGFHPPTSAEEFYKREGIGKPTANSKVVEAKIEGDDCPKICCFARIKHWVFE